MSYDEYRGGYDRSGYENTRSGAYGRTQSYDGRGYADRGAEHHGYRGGDRVHAGRAEYSPHEDMGMSRGELRNFIVQVIREQAEEMFAEQGFYRGEKSGHDELHARYKDALESLREIPSAMEATKQFGKYFEGLTEEDKKVLTQLVQRPPLKKMAASAGVSPEKFWKIKHELQYKLKQ